MSIKKNIFQFAVAVFTAFSAFAQPANNDCAGAISLGTLPTPGACVSGLQNGNPTTLNNQSTVGATAGNPYIYQTQCTGGGNMQTFALDTWYSFTASGTIANVNVTGFPNANIAVWAGTCGNLLGRGCMILPAGGSGTLTVTQTVPGQTYYIQISGNTTTATDASFSLAVDNDTDCNDCLLAGSLTATPAPVNGGYQPGQVVQFCYTVSGWSQQNTNWFHGVQITYGSGWTGGITGAVPATTSQNIPGPGSDGDWLFYPTGIGNVNGTNWGPGFYFDTPDAGTAANNNFGDDCNGTACTWTFCWNLTVSSSCAPGTPLTVTVNTSGDGESGSWQSPACTDDNATNFTAIQICCTAPTMASTPQTCIGVNNGTATATHGTGASPWDYVWTNASGTVVGSTMNSTAASNTITGLAPGTYVVTITDNNNCVSSNTVTVAPGVNCQCLINNFTTNIGFCQPDNTFPVSGTFVYSNAPATGTLVVEVTTATGTYTQTFNPPFVNGQTYNYNITNAVSDGSASTVEIYFTADLACTQLINFTAPAACGCAAEIGTFTADIIGTSNNNYVLCYGDVIDIQTNNDWVAPGEATNPPGPTYDPGVSWLIFSCPPTVGLVPSATQDVADDPCLLGLVSDFDLNDLNDMGIINSFPAGTFTNNTVYYVPITMYSIQDGVYSYVNTTVPCYELGTPYAVQYLPQINSTIAQSCTAVTVTVSGGLPAVNGSQFSTIAGTLTPANASFGNTTASNNGTFTINGLTPGQAFSFQFQDANGCPRTVTGTFTGAPTITYPQPAYCKNGTNPSPTITGPAGGSYTASPAGLSINATTGVVNLTASTAGTYTVTYTSPAVPGPSCTATTTITINAVPTVTVNNSTICAGATATVTATPVPAGTYNYAWTVPGGVTAPGNVASFTTTTAGTYSVVITNPTTGCVSTSASGTVTINPLPTVTVNSPAVCAGANATVTATPGTAGTYSYAWTVPAGATAPGNVSTFTTSVAGTYSVVITNTTTTCVSLPGTGTVTVNPLPTIVANDVSVCTGGTVAITASGATTYTWAPATFLSATTGSSVNFVNGTTTTYTVTGTDANGCISTDPVTVTVNGNAPINAGPDVSICAGASTTITATGGSTYTWAGLGTNASYTVSPATTTTYNLTGADANGCVGADAITVTVNPNPTVTVNSPTVCAGTNATVTATPTPAGIYNYAWTVPGGATNPGNVASFTATVNGTYSVIITNATTLCSSASASGTVTINPNPTVTVNSPTVCAGTTATVTASPTPAGTYNYAWTVPGGATNPGNVASFAATVNGTYSVIITNPTTGCVSPSASGTVTINPNPTVTVNSPTVCAGTNATVTATPGTAGTYNYAWTVPAGATASGNVATFTTTIAGTYSVILTDPATGCVSTSASGTVTVNPNPTVTVNSPTVCAGTNATVTATPLPAGTYNYAWTVPGGATNPGNVASFTATVNGTYSVIITNPTTTCSSTSASGTVTINPNPSATVNSPTVCAGTPASVTATPGTPGTYNYTWTVPAGATNPGNASNFTATVSGTYSVVLTNPTTGCVSPSASGVVTINPIPVITLTPTDPSVCNGTDGSVLVNGTGTGTVAWTGTTTGSTAGVTLPYSIPNLGAGNYNVTYTVASTGCVSTTVSTTLNNPGAPVINAMPNLVTCGTPITINESSITGTNLTSNIGFFSSPNGVGPIADGTTFNSPTPTTTVYVYDVNGVCTAQISFTVTVNPIPTVTVNSPTVCAGTPATVTATPGAAGTYSYAWTVPAGATNPGNVATFTTTTAGTYSVIITNTTTNCVSSSASGTVTVNPNPTVTVNSPAVCAGNPATVTATPGTAGTYSYAWTVPAGAGAPGNVATFNTTTAGTYSVIITNTTTTCVSTSASGTVTINPLPTATVNSPTVCAGTPATVTASPGVAGSYSFAWTVPAGAAAPGNVATFTTTTAGTYSVVLTNTLTGCVSASASGTVTVNANPTVTVNSPTVCAGTPAAVTATPGTAGTYSYAWTVPAGATAPGNVANFNTSIAGTYSVVITNTTTTCVSPSASGTVTINPNPTVTVNSSTVCAGTPATVTATPGTAGVYDYAWTVPATATPPGNVATFTTTTAGTYSVIITNTTTGCFSTSASGTVTVNPLPTATIAGTVTLCQNEPQPTVTFTGANGTAPYTFTYNLNNGANQTITSVGSTATISVPTSTAGTFSYNLVSVQDASSTACSQTQTGVATITVNPLPTATVSGTSQVCEGGASQTVTFTGANGTAPYTFTYNINNGPAQTITSTGNTATITVPTTTPGVFNYNLMSVEDASATTCSQTQTGTATVTINALPNVFAGNNVSVCDGQTVTLTGSGANIYTWDNGVTNGAAFNPPAATTTYTVTGTTTAGCIGTDQVDVTVNPLPLVSFEPSATIGCAPLTVTFTNTTVNSSNCVWTMSDGTVLTGCGSVTNTFEQPGCYDISLTTTSTDGCTNTFTAANLVCVEANPIAAFSPSTNMVSEFNSEVVFTNNSEGASDYQWFFGDESQGSTEENPTHDYVNAEVGEYTVTLIATTPYGCADTAYSIIQVYEELIFYVPNTFTPDYDNYNQFFTPVFTSGYDPYDYTLYIFNRWGELIFESHNAQVGWDGSYGSNREIEMVQDGTYTWKIEFKVTKNDERKMYVGHVNVLR